MNLGLGLLLVTLCVGVGIFASWALIRYEVGPVESEVIRLGKRVDELEWASILGRRIKRPEAEGE